MEQFSFLNNVFVFLPAQVSLNHEIYIEYGGLPYQYKAAQFHFHWGEADRRGSEHSVDSEAFPMEVRRESNGMNSSEKKQTQKTRKGPYFTCYVWSFSGYLSILILPSSNNVFNRT